MFQPWNATKPLSKNDFKKPESSSKLTRNERKEKAKKHANLFKQLDGAFSEDSTTMTEK